MSDEAAQAERTEEAMGRMVLAGAPVQDLDEVTRKLWLLLFGRQGAGKTYEIGTASEVPFMCPILYISIEGGHETLFSNFPEAVKNKTIQIVTPVEVIDRAGKIIRTKWEHIEAIFEAMRMLRAQGKLVHKTLAIDSLSEAYELCMQW